MKHLVTLLFPLLLLAGCANLSPAAKARIRADLERGQAAFIEETQGGVARVTQMWRDP